MKNNVIIGITLVALLVGVFFVAALQKETPSSSDDKKYIQKKGDYDIFFNENISGLKAESSRLLTFKIRDPESQILKNFDVKYEKLLHFIVVRHDLQYFQHLDPEYDPVTGEFTVEAAFPAEGSYRMVAEFTPPRFEGNPNSQAIKAYEDVVVTGKRTYDPQSVDPSESSIRKVGDYTVEYKLPAKIEAGKEFTYLIAIKKNDRPLARMGEYLGALAHGIIFNTATLEAEHVHSEHIGDENSEHEMQMEMLPEQGILQPDITFKASLPRAGIYKVFTEFENEDEVVVSDYTFKVE